MGRHLRHKRDETVQKAMTLFWKNGFSGTSMRILEDALDMRPGSIYAAFGSKEKLFLTAISHYADQSFKRFQSHMAATDSFLLGLRNFLKQTLLDPDLSGACMLVKTLADRHPDNEILRERAGHMFNDFDSILVSHLEKARNRGEISRNCDIKALARFIQVLIVGLRSYAEVQNSEPVIRQLLDDALLSIETKYSK